MCGIVGYISDRHYEKEIENAVQEMYHRGPDNQQTKLFETDTQKIGFGHARLSILDLDPRSHQPFTINNGQLIIIFNGEIYNYKSIKKKLEDQNITFTTRSDTEVFLKAYEAYGIECVKKFRGIFTAAIFDIKKDTLILVRDQLGIKPLYFFKDKYNNLFFASELKSLFNFSAVKKKISQPDICQFLNMGFVMEPNTGFEEVYKLYPGSYLTLDKNCVTTTVYFEPNVIGNTNGKKTASKINRATKEQALADVPLALLYSGGLDSSLLASNLDKSTKCLFLQSSEVEIKNAGLVNDKDYALKIADHLDLNIDLLSTEPETNDDFLLEIERVARMVEEPICDYTFIASEKLCQKARNHGYKVVISGMGGDEGFGGYPRYILAKNYSLFRKIRFLIKLFSPILNRKASFSKKVQRLLSFLYEKTFALGYIRLIGYLSSKEISELLHDQSHQTNFENYLDKFLSKYKHITPLKQALILDSIGFLSHNLIVSDKSSMLASVEMRVPLLDPTVYQSGIETDDEKLISNNNQKVALQKILLEKLPKELVSRPKAGFNPPLDAKINNLGYEKIVEEFSNDLIIKYINPEPLLKILRDHFKGNKNNTYKIWQLLFLNQWLKVWAESD